jgi:hypothetical protein
MIEPQELAKSADYRMISSLTVENFRCFQRVKLTDLRRVNLLVGDSGSGKTALLEAIFLNLGVSPELVLRIRAWRGQDQVQISTDQRGYSSIWNDLFHKFDSTKEISISFDDSAAERRTVKIKYTQGKELVLPLGNGSGSSAPPSSVAPIEFTYELGTKRFSVVPEMTARGLRVQAANLPPVAGVFFATQSQIGKEQYAGFYSDLSRQKREGEIVDLLRTEFPYVESLSVEISHGVPMLFASVPYLPEKIPVTLLSSGINKLLCLLLAVASQRNGVVVVDEIETGFYWERMPSIWRLLLRFAKRYGVQIFASTHSSECLSALASVSRKRPDDAVLIRMQTKDGISTAEQFLGSSFFRGMRLGEVR